MKKIFFTMLMAVVCSTAAVAQDTAYKITGKLPAGVHQVLVIANNGRTPLHTDTICKDGKFAFAGNAPKDALFTIFYVGNDQRGGINLFNDGTPIDIDFINQTATASALNLKLKDFQKQISNNFKLQNELGKEMHTQNPTEARKKEIEARLEQLDKESTEEINAFIRTNKDNILPAALAGEYAYMLSYEELAAFCDSATAYYNHPMMTRAKHLLEGLGKRRAGQQYHELTMQDMEGKTVSLSQWVGKGNYVLVDFWASWCGPCRREMPNVVAAYKRYHDSKGFDIVGVSFDNNGDKWKEAVKQLGMEWHQMSDLKGWQCAAGKVYGVNSIPSNVLIDPQGKIIASDLTGEALGAKLKEIFGE